MSDAGDSLDREKWEAERAFREREVALKERELVQTRAAARWKSPVVVAILAAAVAAAGNAIVAYTNASSQTKLEAQKAEQARILEVIKTGSPDKAAENLQFLVDAGLVSDPTVRRKLSGFLAKRSPGSGPTLPSSSGAAGVVTQFEGTKLKPYRDEFGRRVIGTGHELTEDELRSGMLVIAGKTVDWRSGITQAQADQLLAQDLEPLRERVDDLVEVKLTRNQLDALTSFAYNVGVGVLAQSTLLKKLNAGRYDEVPGEMMKWAQAGGRTIPGLVARRQVEVDLWNRQG